MASFHLRMPAATLICLLASLINLPARASAACYTSSTNIYWIPIEGSEDMSYNGLPLSLRGPKTRSLVDSNGAVIAYVAEPTFQKCKEEGVCYLEKDELGRSRLVSYVGGGNVFNLLSLYQFPFGFGGWNNQLYVFVSVASSDYPPRTKLYIKELDGLDLRRPPEDAFVNTHHNGCVRVDDLGPTACSLNFFVGFFAEFKRLRAHFPVQVQVEPRSTCEILYYLESYNE